MLTCTLNGPETSLGESVFTLTGPEGYGDYGESVFTITGPPEDALKSIDTGFLIFLGLFLAGGVIATGYAVATQGRR